MVETKAANVLGMLRKGEKFSGVGKQVGAQVHHCVRKT